MPVFRDADQMHDFYKGLFGVVTAKTNFGKKLDEYGITLKFILKDPDGVVWVGPDRVLVGEEASQDADTTMEMTADIAHDVWLKKITVNKAVLTKKIKVKGSSATIMKLFPHLKSILDEYPEYCEKQGLPL